MLSENERKGFAQYFYLTMCGHLEAVLAECINVRLRAIEMFVSKDSVQPASFRSGENIETVSIDPLIGSIRGMSNSLNKQVKNAPLSNLIEQASMLFFNSKPIPLSTAQREVLLALGDLRNVFAHNRNLVFHVEHKGIDVLAGSALNKAIKILRVEGIMAEFDSLSDSSTFDIVYSDEAMLFFYSQAKNIDRRLRETTVFGPQWFQLHIIPELPAIEA